MISFVWKGYSSILLNIEDLSILLDPSNNFTLEELEDLTDKVDIVAYTHEHSGHFDMDFLMSLIERYNPYMVVNKGVFRLIRRKVDWDKLFKLKSGEMLELGGTRIHALRAVHPGIHPVVFLIEIGGKAIFHGDSTGFTHMFEAFSPVNLAFVPVGKPSPNASPKDAIRIIKALSPRVVVPFHGDEREIEDLELKVKLANLNVEVIKPVLGELTYVQI